MEDIMKKRQKEKDDAYDAEWDDGRGSHHPDYDPYACGEGVVQASRQTEELYNAIVMNDIKLVYQKIAQGIPCRHLLSPTLGRFTSGVCSGLAHILQHTVYHVPVNKFLHHCDRRRCELCVQ